MVRFVSIFCVAVASFLSGCCCVPQGCVTGGLGCGTCAAPVDACGCGGGCDNCLPTLADLAGLSSCKGACGEVYIDERINEPPCADHCGFSDCGGCGQCRNCRPLLATLGLLWGTPYRTCCDTGFGCDQAGCSSCDGGYVDGGHVTGGHAGGSCNCGHGGSSSTMEIHAPAVMDEPIYMPSQPSRASEVMPAEIPGASSGGERPTLAPAITPTSARRINPATQRRASRQTPAYR